MATTDHVTELLALYDSASAAMSAADWSTAKVALMKCKTLLAIAPDVGRGSTSVRFKPDQLDSLIAECNREIAAARTAASSVGPWQATKITYARPTS